MSLLAMGVSIRMAGPQAVLTTNAHRRKLPCKASPVDLWAPPCGVVRRGGASGGVAHKSTGAAEAER